MAKAFVCFQAGWMVIQIIARKASGLPITLLEINTLGHVVCAVTMYLAWWHKPQDATEPLVIEVTRPIAALMSPHGFRRMFNRPDYESPIENRVSDDEVWKPLHFKCIKAGKRVDGVVMLLGGQRLENTSVEYSCHAKHFTQDSVDMLSLIFASDMQSSISSLDFGPDAERRLTVEAENMRIPGNLKSLSKTKSLMMLAALNLLYGGLHATSWNSHFPTHIEQMMWCVAVCVVAGGGFVALGWNCLRIRIQRKLLGMEKGSKPLKITRHRGRLCCFVCNHWHFYFNKINPDPLTAKKFGIFRHSWERVFEIIVFLSIVARMYLIVEAFISVRSLAAGAYSSVTWTNVLPHIG